ncbi:hypothetical protein TKK_0016139 [Trichogramma kaykai]
MLDPVFESLSFEMEDDLKEKINFEWQELPKYNLPPDISEENKIDIFWLKISGCLDENDCSIFPNLSEFALLVMVIIPNSNASSERFWSKLNLTKTLLRTKLDLETTKSLLMSSEWVSEKVGILNLNLSEEMLLNSLKSYTEVYGQNGTLRVALKSHTDVYGQNGRPRSALNFYTDVYGQNGSPRSALNSYTDIYGQNESLRVALKSHTDIYGQNGRPRSALKSHTDVYGHNGSPRSALKFYTDIYGQNESLR